MTKHLLSGLAVAAETLAHASMIVENSEDVSLWMLGAGLVGVCMASAAIIPLVREVLLFNGPLQIE